MQIPPLLLDRSRTEPLTTQLADQLRDAIRQGRIPAGARLPSSRRLSEQLYVARNTIVRAYEALTMEGYLETRSASGVFAASAPALAAAAVAPVVAQDSVPAAITDMPMPRQVQRVPTSPPNRQRLNFNFAPGRPRAALFPVKVWRRLLQGCLSYGGGAGLTLPVDGGGLPVLRAAIAAHLAFSRGMVVDAAQIVIVSGIQEGLSIAARMFIAPGDTALTEDPCYAGAASAFEAADAQLVGIPVDECGLMTQALPEGRAALLYVTPSHQYPTGHVLSLARRHELVAWARRTGCYLIEDDHDSAFHYDGSPLPALASLGPDCCICLGSFSASLGAGLRLGYMVVPAALADATRDAKALHSGSNPWLDQAALGEFMRSGSYAAHLTRCRAEYKDSRDALVGALRRHFGDVRLSGEHSGLHVFWQLPAGVPEALRLEDLARQARIGLCALAAANVHWTSASSTLARRGIVLGYATMQPRQIEQAVARLSDIVDDTLDNQPGFVEELLRNEPPRPAATPLLQPVGRRGLRPAPPYLQQPALRTVAARRAQSIHDVTEQEDSAMRLIRGIYRYPVKGLSPQPVRGVELEVGKAFPFDRLFALARPGVPIDAAEPQWAKKGLFVMLMLDDALAQVQTQLDVQTLRFEITQGGAPVLAADLNTAAGRAEVETFFQRLVPRLDAPPRLVRSNGGHFMDKPDNVISLINLSTLRSLEQLWGRAVDPLRFRANIYIDGLRPWEEFDWVGSDIRLGDALLRVDRRNGRCGATNVNPVSGERDMDIPSALRAHFGHKDLGIYLVVRKAGKVVVGDAVTVPEFDAPAAGAAAVVPSGASVAGARRHICRGCYFIYDETLGLPASGIAPGTTFADLPSPWRCPDCGTEKATFRPHTAEPLGTLAR